MSDTWIDIGGLDEIPQKGSRVVKTASGDVAVFRTAGDTVFDSVIDARTREAH